MNNELSKIEKVALQMFASSCRDWFTMEPHGVQERMEECFAEAYRFLDVSKKFQRHYE